MAPGEPRAPRTRATKGQAANPRLALGTMNFGDTVAEQEANRILDAAAAAGIRCIDTANVYSNGAAEVILGRWLKRRSAHSFEIATKVGMPVAASPDLPPLGHSEVVEQVRASLTRLGLERVDLLYLHQPDRSTPVRQTLEAVRDLACEGSIGRLGVSNFSAWQIEVLDREAEQCGAPRPAVAQQLYNLLARGVEDQYFEYARVKHLPTVAYNPLAGGLLAKSTGVEEEPTSGRFGASALASMYRARYWRDELLGAAKLLRDVAASAGMSAASLAYRWLLGSPDVDQVIVGASGVDHVYAASDALQAGPLPADVHDVCSQISDQLRSPMPRYNR